jgi:hypothetical protein
MIDIVVTLDDGRTIELHKEHVSEEDFLMLRSHEKAAKSISVRFSSDNTTLSDNTYTDVIEREFSNFGSLAVHLGLPHLTRK